MGHIAKDCRQPKKLSWKPVPERTKQISIATKTPHASLSWTGCYDDNCFTHRSNKEATGHWPSNPDCGRTGYDMTIPEVKTKTLAMAFQANSKIVRKTTKQLDEMLRVQQLNNVDPNPIRYDKKTQRTIQELEEPVKEESDEEPEHQHDPLTEQQILSLTSNWTVGEGESSPYDSDEPRDAIRRRAQTEITYGLTPSTDDSSSEEESDDQEDRFEQFLKYQEINMLEDKQQRHFYGIPANQRNKDYTPQLHVKDYPALHAQHRHHRTLFWPQCIFDKCKEHMGDKHEHQLYPRRHSNNPIPEIYTTHTMIGWTIIVFNGYLATFRPSPQYPMRCQHDKNMKWEECRKDDCLIYAAQKAKAYRLLQEGPSPPRPRFQENRLTKARREGKQITYPGQPEQSKN
ncbi:hypothetical protein CcaCcLH18_14137 [Colletotrichum camelliae]|nr:hypothetical protein CcaCcLH18_14137 [Colletotrichum camelliae]